MSEKKQPELNELVVATVKKILPYGAFCTLNDYGSMEAFLHVSEVASRWVKNIHEFLKEGQTVVARVHRLTPEKRQIDLSLRRVSEQEKKAKLEARQREKRGMKLFELCAKRMKVAPAQAFEGIGKKLVEKYGDFYSALEQIALEGKALDEVEMSEGWKRVLLEVAKENIKPPEVHISGILNVSLPAPDGIDHIKKALLAVAQIKTKGAEVKIHYLGAPHYQLSVKAGDYKSAEKALAEAQALAQEKLKGAQIEFSRAS